MITETRKHVSELIENNKDKEIKCNSDYQSAGIYMIYVDCFESDTIIPFLLVKQMISKIDIKNTWQN